MILRLLLLLLAMLSVLSGCVAQNHAQKKPGSNPSSSSAPQQPQILQNSANSSTPDLADGPERHLREPHALSLADLRAKYRTTFILNGPGTKREIALSFDDAPDDNFTPKVLDVLKSEGVKATFFVVGNRIEKHPDIMKRIVEEGHILGNHSYNHANLPKLSDAEFREQIIKTDQLICEHTGYIPNIVRPPYGNISEDQIKWLASQKKKVINWNVDSLDWKGLDAEEVKTNVLAHVSPGAIILQHSAGGTGQDLSGTVVALPEIIRTLKNDGVKLVTIPELLDLNVK
ncbi:polysaccharide deacetylase family protein [Paenibacillus dendritiformis]|uniref:polysaccharide deacetylase family protein n=1 Tax=Paenibacillus dendritiformis TaxID=130049 RepID=UPI001F0F4B46|nr:polysaccharide deacetylase family protein [Paenibacillus dendritiformis]